MEFACETFESVESSRQSQVKLVNSDMQTDPIMVKSAEVQAVIVKKSKQTQAEASEIDQTLVEEEDVRLDPTDPLFKIFLKKSIVIITEELKKTLSSHAFDDFVFENEIDDEASSISKLYVLTNLPRTAISLKKESEKGNESLKEVKSNVKSKATVSKKAEKVVKSSNLSTSSVSWNSSGNIVAVSYSSTAHSGFCEHISGFSCWNLVKRSFDCNSPDTDFETPCCVSALSFHPILPSVIAIGLYTGEIRIYDISLAVGEELVCASGMEDYTHNEPVNKIKWVSDPIVKNDYFLASVSGDGKLLYWSWSVGNVLLTPSYGSRIKPLHKSSTSFGHIGGTSFDVSNTVVIGTEGGHLFRSSLPVYKKKEGDWTIDAWRLIQDSQDREDIRKIVEKYAKINSVNSLTPSLLFSLVPATKIYPNAIQSSYTHHLSWISALQFSPFQPRIFLSSSIDGLCRINSTLNTNPLLSFYRAPILDLSWSQARTGVFCLAVENTLEIYDLTQSQRDPVIQFPCKCTCVSWNRKDASLIAVGDSDGHVTICKVSSRLASENSLDRSIIDTMLSSANKQELDSIEDMNV